MRRSFYHWLMTQRDSKVDLAAAELADLVFTDTAFPRQSSDFDQISRYLEEEASFVFNLSQFDQIWETYLAH